MKKEEIKIRTLDGLELEAIHYMPSVSPEIVIIIVHGLGEHIGRYQNLIEFFVGENFSVFAYNQRGHGNSPGKRGHTPGYIHLLNDCENMLKIARRTYNSAAIFLYGQSLGGNIVLNFTLRRQTSEISGVVASSPFLKLGFDPPPFKIKLGRLMAGIWPSFSQGNEIEPELLSHKDPVVEAYKNDPLVHESISAKMFVCTVEAGKWALEHANAFKIPLLIMHGTEDKITDPEASKKFAGKVGGMAVLKLWDGLLHELHQEVKAPEVMMFVKRWIDGVSKQ